MDALTLWSAAHSARHDRPVFDPDPAALDPFFQQHPLQQPKKRTQKITKATKTASHF